MLNNKFVLLAVALFAISSSAWVVRILPDTSAITLAFWRMFLASVLVFVLSYKSAASFVPNKKMLLAGIFLGIHFALFFRSVQLTSIAEATLLGTTAPIFTEIYSFVFQKKKPVGMVVFGLCVAFLGAGTLVSQSSFSETSTLGNLFAIMCSIAMAQARQDGRSGGWFRVPEGGGVAGNRPNASVHSGMPGLAAVRR